jgi:hypothetical protein
VVAIHVAQMGTLPPEEQEGKKDVKRCRSTLHRRAHLRRGGGFERRGWSTLHRRTHSRQERGWREEVAIHVAQMGTLPPEGLGEERDEGGERRYPSTMHTRIPSESEEAESPKETEENRHLQLLK